MAMDKEESPHGRGQMSGGFYLVLRPHLPLLQHHDVGVGGQSLEEIISLHHCAVLLQNQGQELARQQEGTGHLQGK